MNGDRVGSVAPYPLAHLGLAARASNRPTKEGRIQPKPDYFDRARSRVDWQPPVEPEGVTFWGPWNARDVPSRTGHDGPAPTPTIDDRLDYGGRHRRRTDPNKPAVSLPPGQADNRDTVAELVVQDGMLLRLASSRLRADRDIVMKAAAQNAEAFKFAAPALRADPKLVEYLSAEDPLVLDYSDLSGPQKAEMAARVLQRAGASMLFKYATPDSIYVRLMQDDSFAYHAIRKNRTIARHRAAYPQGRTLEFFRPLAENDPLLLTCMPKPVAMQMVTTYPQLRQTFATLVRKLQAMGIDNFNRLPDIELVREIVKNRTTPANDSRPVAIVITPAKDWNGAFEMNSIRELSRAYRVMYYETDTDQDFYRAVVDATAQKKASVLIIGGHGAQDLLSFGADDPSHTVETNEELYLDFSDRAEMREMALADRLERGAQIVVDSCNAGQGEDTAENIVNLVADSFPKARVYGPIDSTNKVLVFGRDGRLLHPRFLWNVGTYTVEPRNIVS